MLRRLRVGDEGVGVELRDLPRRLARAPRPLLHLVLAGIGIGGQMTDVGDVHHVPHAVAVPLEHAFQQVLEEEGPVVADVLIVVDGGAARVEADFAARNERGERAQRARVVVVEVERVRGMESPDADLRRRHGRHGRIVRHRECEMAPMRSTPLLAGARIRQDLRSAPRCAATPHPAVRARDVWALFAIICHSLVRQSGQPPARPPRRRPLCRDRTRDGRDRRLGDAAPERPQVLRKAAAPVLGDGARLRSVRRPRVDCAAVAGARRFSRGACDRLCGFCAGRGDARRIRGARARGNAVARGHRADRHARFRALVLSCARIRCVRRGAATGDRAIPTLSVDGDRLGGDGRRNVVERA